MSTISASSALYPTPYGSTSSNASSSQDGIAQALNDLGSALDSNDSADAQTALTALQTALAAKKTAGVEGTNTSTSTENSKPFGGNSQANTDYANLVNDVQSGNLTGAQSALANLQTDLKSASKSGHHHHGAPPPPPTTDSTDSTQTTSSTDNQAQLSPTTFQTSFTSELLNSNTTSPSITPDGSKSTAGNYVNTTV